MFQKLWLVSLECHNNTILDEHLRPIHGYNKTVCVAMEYDDGICTTVAFYEISVLNKILCVIFEDVERTKGNLIHLWIKHMTFKPVMSFTCVVCFVF